MEKYDFKVMLNYNKKKLCAVRVPYNKTLCEFWLFFLEYVSNSCKLVFVYFHKIFVRLAVCKSKPFHIP